MQPDDVIGEHRAEENSLSSQCDPSPRRAAVDMGQKNPEICDSRSRSVQGQDPEHREPRRKPRKNFSLLKPVWMVFCVQQKYILLPQPDVGVDDEKETTATSQQAAVREEFASPTEKRQQQGTTAWTTEQNKHFDRGRSF